MDQTATQPESFSVRLDADGASRIEGAGWNLRVCGPTVRPDSITLLAAAFGACAAQVCAPILCRAGLTTEALDLELSLTSGGAQGLTGITVDLHLAGGDPELAQKLVRAIRNCPVRRCLNREIICTIRLCESLA